MLVVRGQNLFDLKACPIGRDKLKVWVGSREILAREGIPPSAGLKLFHCRQNIYTLIALHPALKVMSYSFSLPQISKHLISKTAGFLGRESGAGGEFVKSIQDCSPLIFADGGGGFHIEESNEYRDDICRGLIQSHKELNNKVYPLRLGTILHHSSVP